MNTVYIIEEGIKGNHVLFPSELICEAFNQDASVLQRVADERKEEVGEVINELLSMPDLNMGRSFIERLPQEFQYILILLYFQLVDRQLSQRQPTIQ